jgi:hypothetical protein
MNEPVHSTFCGIETVSCVVGLSRPRIYDLVDAGHFLWVWDVSSGVGVKRNLRFLSQEINDSASVSKLTIDTVIKTIIPKRDHITGQSNGIRSWEFRHLLRICKSSLNGMYKELGIRGTPRNLIIPQASLERFFRNRWIGTLHPNGVIKRSCPPKSTPRRKRLLKK